MMQKLKFLTILFIATVGVAALFGVQPAYAKGEKWELVDKTSIKVSGGLFSGPTTWSANGQQGTTSNPRSITLKPRDGNGQTSPSIWIATTSFALLDDNGNAFEGENNNSVARQKGEFCVSITNFASLLKSRTSAGISPIHREDCNKPLTDPVRIIVPGPVTGEYMKCGFTRWNCNTLWSTSFPAALSGSVKLAYAIPGAPLKCGDPGFTGPCAVAYNPITADCSKTNGSPGEGEKCETIKACIMDASKSESECAAAWTDCVASYPSDNINYNSCKASISKGDFQGGKFVEPTADEAKTSSCSVDGIGWIVCPLANAIASMADMAFDVVSAFMRVEPLGLDTSSNNPLYSSWAVMRSIANVAFVIAFLIIIYSQLTGSGISNYGVKKMLPRLVVTAILVNVSYFICAIAVDISNILGMSLQEVLNAIRAQSSPGGVTTEMATWSNITAAVLSGGAIAVGGAAFVALSSTTVWAALVGLLPLLISSLFALVVAFLVLLLRQALIIILIVIAPLAFVAYLLPNTESLFKKWKDLFTALLLLFPILSLVFGGSQLAAAILRASAEKTMQSNDLGVAMTGFFLYIGAVAIQVIPFFITPLLLKVSSGVLGRFGGMINHPNKGPFDGAKRWAEGKAKNADNKAYVNKLGSKRRLLDYGARRRARSSAIGSSLEQESKRAETGYIASAAQDVNSGESFRQKMAGSDNPESMQRVLANAINVEAKIEADEVTAASAIIKSANLGLNEMQALAKGNSVSYTDSAGVSRTLQGAPGSTLQTAAIQNQFKSGDVSMADELISMSGSMDIKQRQAIAEGAQSLSGKVKYYGGTMGEDIAKGKINSEADLNAAVASTLESGKFSEQDLAVQDKDSLFRISKVAADPSVNASQLRATATNLKANVDIYPTVEPRKRNRIDAIESGVAYAGP